MISHTYDIILLCGHVRACYFYLNFVKALSSQIDIGIMPLESIASTKRSKLTDTEALFTANCSEFGGHILSPEENFTCSILFAPQDTGGELAKIKVSYRKLIGLNTLGQGSRRLHQLKSHKMKKFWVPELKIFHSVLEREDALSQIDDLDVAVMGVPYKKYPAWDFSGLEIDYLIAYPSPMLIRSATTRVTLLRNMLDLIDAIPSSKKIMLARHNVHDRGFQMVGRTDPIRELILALVPACLKIIGKGALSDPLNRLYSQKLARDLENQVIMLSQETNLYNFGIEHFLPFVRDGVITGISGCLWHSIYNEVPCYNCSDQELNELIPNFAVYKNFFVPPCKGRMDYSPEVLSYISKEVRDADVVEMIKNEL